MPTPWCWCWFLPPLCCSGPGANVAARSKHPEDKKKGSTRVEPFFLSSGLRFGLFGTGRKQPAFEGMALPEGEQERRDEQEPEEIQVRGQRGGQASILRGIGVDAGEHAAHAGYEAFVVGTERPVDQSGASDDILAWDEAPD